MQHQNNILFRILFLLATAVTQTHAQTPAKTQTPPALTSIRNEDIRSDIFTMAGDHFRGREAGTLDELKAAAWVADKAKAAGLRPGGDDGTWFQFFSLWRNRISPLSTISIDDHPFPLWTDVLIPQTATATVNAPILFIDKADTNRTDLNGKAIALMASPEG